MTHIEHKTMAWHGQGRSFLPESICCLQADQGGESSGNNASNGTTQRLNKNEQALAEASTAAKPQGDDLHELSRRGFCAHPLTQAGKPAQAVSHHTSCRPAQANINSLGLNVFRQQSSSSGHRCSSKGRHTTYSRIRSIMTFGIAMPVCPYQTSMVRACSSRSRAALPLLWHVLSRQVLACAGDRSKRFGAAADLLVQVCGPASAERSNLDGHQEPISPAQAARTTCHGHTACAGTATCSCCLVMCCKVPWSSKSIIAATSQQP